MRSLHLVQLLFVACAAAGVRSLWSTSDAERSPDSTKRVNLEPPDFAFGEAGARVAIEFPERVAPEEPSPVFARPSFDAPLPTTPARRSESLATSSIRRSERLATGPGSPSRELSPEETDRFRTGRRLFEHRWTRSEGLGSPHFNGKSCAVCHKDPVTGGSGDNDFNVIVRARDFFRGSIYESGAKKHSGLAEMRALKAELIERGDTDEVRRLLIEIQTPSLLGLGAIASIFDQEILRNEDPHDLDGDGIRGTARRLKIEPDGHEEIGRFGWKAQTPKLSDFVCMALAGETGITAPDQGRGFGLAKDHDRAQDPEIPQDDFDALTFFIETLAAPARVGSHEYETLAGEVVFAELGCVKCHVPVLEGLYGGVRLYSDLLIHDIAAEDKTRTGRKLERQQRKSKEPRGFRTAPLWGVRQTAPYLHDGSAPTLRDAILAHHGEAAGVRQSFEEAAPIDQDALLLFLADL